VLKTLALGGEREVEAEVFSAAEVEARLGLAREDLVAAMLLLGGDFSDGAAGMGPAKTRWALPRAPQGFAALGAPAAPPRSRAAIEGLRRGSG